MILRLKSLTIIMLFTPNFAVILAHTPNHGLAVENKLYMDMVDDLPIVEWVGLEKEECAVECKRNRCTYFFYKQDGWLCKLYEGTYFSGLTISEGWRYYDMKALTRHARFGHLTLVSDPQSKQLNMAKIYENYVQNIPKDVARWLGYDATGQNATFTKVICPSDYEFIADTYSCIKMYTAVGTYSTYDEKRAKCAEHGGNLLKIDSYFKQHVVEEFIGKQSVASSEYIIIQGKWRDPVGPFVYDDDTELLYENWNDPAQIDPSHPCIALSVSNMYKWKSVQESLPDSSFICELSFQ